MEPPRQKAKRWATLAVLAVLIALCAATSAHAYVYGTGGVGNGAPIGRASLDGGGVRPRFVTHAGSTGIAVDATHIYFTGDADHAGTIGRANLDGTGVERVFIRAGAGRGALAVDGAHIYWTDQIGTTPTIGRANLDGTSVDRGFLTLPVDAYAIAVDGAHIYWGSWHAIGRANLDGSAADPRFVPAVALYGLAVDGGHIYWSNRGGKLGSPGTIGRANLDGSGVDQRFVMGPRGPTGLAVDRTHVYWGTDTDTIGRADLDGSNVDQQFLAVGANDIAVDALGPQPAPSTDVYINCQNRLVHGFPSDTLVPLQHPKRCTVWGQPESIATLYPLGDVHWSGWGDATATAKAVWHNPSPREGPPSPIRVKAFRIRLGCAGRRFYTRVAVPGLARPIVLRLSEACKLPTR